MILLLVALAHAAEPDWFAHFDVPATSGPPMDACAGGLVVESPSVVPVPVPTSTEPPPTPPTNGMLAWDMRPGATNSLLPDDLRKRLGLPGAFDVATIPLEPLRGHPDDIARVHAVLTRAGRREGITRLAFWGASHVAGEFFTGELRRLLQDRYGDAGHGFVMPAAPWKGYRASDVNLCTSGAWQSDYHNRSGGRNDGLLGFAGISVEAATPASSGWVQTTLTNPHGRAVSRFEVMYLQQPGGGSMDLIVDDAPPIRIATAGDIHAGGVTLAVTDGPHRLRVTPVGDGPVRLFGVDLERAGPGVIVDAMGVSGRTAASWLAWNDGLMRAYLTRRTPDLVVLAYGTNEANEPRLVEAEYRDTLRAVLTRMRRLLPEQACVLIGPSDRGRKLRGDSYVIWSPTAMVARVQRELGPEFGCATWDLQEATGGPGSMFRWQSVEPTLAAADLIHFSALGYQELARRFLAAMDNP